jgi:hypothetical protein
VDVACLPGQVPLRGADRQVGLLVSGELADQGELHRGHLLVGVRVLHASGCYRHQRPWPHEMAELCVRAAPTVWWYADGATVAALAIELPPMVSAANSTAARARMRRVNMGGSPFS